jgi:cytochrome oxidase Cu insertion factor (SCO1/SenC/PrrC family)/thiol-disulfide isomerase/thioredoxin
VQTDPAPPPPPRRPRPPWLRPALTVAAAFAAGAIVVIVAILAGPAGSGAGNAPVSAATALYTNPNLDPGSAVSGPAPDFTLTDQFGRRVSLSAFRGRVVLLAFNDSQCTTICPLTTTTMVRAKAMLGRAGAGVQLLGVNANPDATAVRWVRAYSEAHGMLHQWQFLTGSVGQLRRVWRDYHIEAQVDAGQIDHTPALYVIDRRGRLAKIYLTQMAYASLAQEAQIVAREVASLLPGHPAVDSRLAYDPVSTDGPGRRVTLPLAGGRTTAIGGRGSPQLLMFFATWLTETSRLASELDALNGYQALVRSGHLPRLVGVDEGSVEPSPSALPRLLGGLPARLAYPVAVDRSGQLADGYEVQDQPWFVLTSSSGRILWYWDATTQGWPSTATLVTHIRAALSSPPPVTHSSAKPAGAVLAGSPPRLAALHSQAGELLGGEPALAARLRALRGYPIVLNAWASWCPPCKHEFPLFAAAALRYGRRIAFVGVNTNDSSGDAESFLAAHPVSYPSYRSTYGALGAIAPVINLPTTVFIDSKGKVCFRRQGGYDAEGALDADIEACAAE